MSWITAGWRGLLIVAYFVVATAWLPNRVIQIDAVATASGNVRDLVVLIVWGGALSMGMVLLRLGQRKGIV